MSKVVEVSAKLPETGQECKVTYDFGKDTEEKIQMFGESVVDSAAEGQFRVGLQAGLRSAMKRGVDPQTYADGYKPGVRAPSIAQDPMSAAKSAYSRMSSEEKAAFLESLKA